MKLNEAEAKKLFAQAGIPVPENKMARSPAEAAQAAREIGGKEVMLKSLILVGGRGKAGAVLKSPVGKAAQTASKLLGHTFKGLTVQQLLVEEALPLEKELYLGITHDRSHKSLVLLFSGEGGIEIEQLAVEHPEKIMKFWFHLPLPATELRHALASFIRSQVLDERIIDKLVEIAVVLSRLVEGNDASLAEINPLAVTPRGLFAVDAKIILDDNALYRHKEWQAVQYRDLTSLEKEARDAGIQYVELDGNIGVIGNGAGLVMATLDVLNYYGGKAANFCDVGGGADTETVLKALEIIRKTNPKVILVNIFGGITQVDLVSRGMVTFREKHQSTIPMVVRIEGRHRIKGKEILNQAGIETLDTIEQCAEATVKLAREGS